MIAQNITVLQQKIEETCQRSDRNPAEVKLIAVSKYFGVDKIIEAKNCGLTDFGENRHRNLLLSLKNLVMKLSGILSERFKKIKLSMLVKA